MVRKMNNRLYKINTYASAHIIEIDDNYDEEVQKLQYSYYCLVQINLL